MDTFVSIGVGVALSAACGFRIFIPPLVMSIAALSGHLPLAPDYQWIGTYPALVAFAVATSIEIAAYYVPWVDNLLDAVSTPGAIAVGTFITAALVHDTNPLLQWTTAVIAGGGSAGLIQTFLGMTRLSSTALTGGLGNHIVATIESFGSVVLSVLAIVLPLLAISLVATLLILILSKGLQVLVLRRQSEKKVT